MDFYLLWNLIQHFSYINTGKKPVLMVAFDKPRESS